MVAEDPLQTCYKMTPLSPSFKNPQSMNKQIVIISKVSFVDTRFLLLY